MELKLGRTMAFVCLSFLELIHSFNIRSEESIFKIGILKNTYLIGAVILGILMQLIVVIIPSLAKLFNVVPLNNVQWIYVAGISILPILIMEGQKKLNKIKYEKYSCQIWKHNV